MQLCTTTLLASFICFMSTISYLLMMIIQFCPFKQLLHWQYNMQLGLHNFLRFKISLSKNGTQYCPDGVCLSSILILYMQLHMKLHRVRRGQQVLLNLTSLCLAIMHAVSMVNQSLSASPSVLFIVVLMFFDTFEGCCSQFFSHVSTLKL